MGAVMLVESEEFNTLHRQAEDLRKASRLADAAALYEPAVQATDGTEENRLEAKLGLGNCLLTLGRHTEALAHLGQVYVATLLALREAERRLNARITGLEESDLDKAAGSPVRRTAQISLFVMMPYEDEYKLLEEALRQVFEDDPYDFQVILARDRTLHSSLFDNVKAHMRLVHGFVADVSDLNPNVMLELGITEVDAQERPVVILRRSGSEEPPADLRGRIYVKYNLPPKREADPVQWLAAQLREKFGDINAIEQLRQNRAVRYLSATHLHRKFGQRLAREETERLCKAFPTIEELEKADRGTIIQKTGLDECIAAMVEAAF
jgi:tetratricopeptide (TPR) repeat protein